LSFFNVPLGSIIGPLIVWLVKRNESEFVDDQGKEAVNFHLSMAVYAIVLAIAAVTIVLTAAIKRPTGIIAPIATVAGFVIFGLLMLFSLIATIVAAISASSGAHFRYPLRIRFIR
jgi:uncharacterized Tic20 family protein